MTRNLSNLQFQRRLIQVALKSREPLATRMLGIVYSNLREFAEVRLPLDPDFYEVADAYVETFYAFFDAVKTLHPTHWNANLLTGAARPPVPYLDVLMKHYGRLDDGIGIIHDGVFYHGGALVNAQDAYSEKVLMELMTTSKEEREKYAFLNGVPEDEFCGVQERIVPPMPILPNMISAISTITDWCTTKPTRFVTVVLIKTGMSRRAKVYEDEDGVMTIKICVESALPLFFDRVADLFAHTILPSESNEVPKSILKKKLPYGVHVSSKNPFGTDTLIRGPFEDPSQWINYIVKDGLDLNLDESIDFFKRDKIAPFNIPVAQVKNPHTEHMKNIRSVYMTLYRSGEIILSEDGELLCSDPNVHLMLYLAEWLGDKFHVYIELRARGSSVENLKLMQLLRDRRADVHVISPFYQKCKVHAKLISVYYANRNGDNLATHIVSTGNFQRAAQKQFADTMLITHMEDGCIRDQEFKRLWGALMGWANIKEQISDQIFWTPGSIKKELLDRIQQCIQAVDERSLFGPGTARIRIKCNHITDPEIVNALMLAAYRGVAVRVIVRTTCTIPVAYRFENLEVNSIAGKYLEHDRFYSFEWSTPGMPPSGISYISTADLMPRNLKHRIEIMTALDSKMSEYMSLQVFDELVTHPSNPDEGFFNFPLSFSFHATYMRRKRD